MNTQEILNALKIVGGVAFAMAAQYGIMTKDQATAIMTDLQIIVPALLSLGAVGWSIYAHWNMKKVPENSVAFSADDLHSTQAAPVGSVIAIPKGKYGGDVAAVKVVGAILIVFMLFAPINPASAQGNFSPILNKFLQTIRAWTAADSAGAIDLATSIPDLQDPVGATCWKTFKGLGEIIDKHPLPATLKLMSDIEAGRLILMSVKKVCAEPACSQVWNDMQNQISTFAPIAAPFTLASICNKVL